MLRPRSLRGQLVALLAVLVIPLIALQAWWGFREYKGATARVGTEALVLADAAAASVQQLLSVSEGMLSALAVRLEVPVQASDRCDQLMRDARDMFSFLTNVGVADREGNVVCSSRPVGPGVSASQWAWFRDVTEESEFVVGAPVFGSVSKAWILPLAVPVLDVNGEFGGAVIGSVPLLEFQRLLGGVVFRDDDLVTITTLDRIVVARSVSPEQWVGKELPAESGFKEMVSPNRWVAGGPDFDGVDRAWGRVEIPDLGWTVYVGTSTKMAYVAPLTTAIGRIGLSALVLLLGILLAVRFYQGIARALRELIENTGHALRRGPTPPPPGTPTEFVAVIEQFNSVAERFDTTVAHLVDAESSERRARTRYQSIFDNAAFGVYVSTLRGRIIDANPALVAMLGYGSAEDLIAAGPDALYRDPSFRVALMDEYLDRGVIDGVEVEWIRADGTAITVRLNGKLTQTDEGESGFEMIVQDITEERSTEDQLRQTHKMDAVGRLAGGIAHDFNNLLTVITGYAEIVREGLGVNHGLREDVDQIRSAATQAAQLTRQLLDYSRKDSRDASATDLNDVVANLQKMLVRLLGADITLQTRLANDPPLLVYVDDGQLQQIIMNLVLNARDATGTGGRITLETSRTLGAPGGDLSTEAGEWVSLTVTDDGTGMDPDIQSRIFEPFFTTKVEGEGTGIGLSTVHDIMQKAGGRIDVESEMGKGTSFVLWFPSRSPNVSQMHEQPLPLDPNVGGHETVLVVEDEDMVALLARRALERMGYRVLVAPDGEAALLLIHGSGTSIDLVVTDVVMPRLGGFDLAKQLAVLRPETPVLFMSGYIDDESLARDVTRSPTTYLPKPFHPLELCARVRQLLDQRQERPLQHA